MKNIRIGSIEYRTVNGCDEIIKWYKNDYYDCEDNNKRLISEGYTRNEDGGWSKDIIHIHSSCTLNEFSSYVIAYIEWNKSHDQFDVRSCGCRAFELDKDNEEDFKTVLELIEKYEINHE